MSTGIPASPDTDTLFRHYRNTVDRASRNELVQRHMWLAERCARRYWDRGEPLDDLIQVASIGLVKAVERYDSDQGTFVGFATPTILGELKRHFRDRTWSVAVPRRAKEMRTSVRTASEVLRQELGRAPTLDEIAARTASSREQVIETLDAERVYRPMSLELLLGGADRAYGADAAETDTVLLVRLLLARVDAQDRHIIFLTYFEDWTQRQIGAHLGIGQVQVSRRLKAALTQLRSLAEDRSRAA